MERSKSKCENLDERNLVQNIKELKKLIENSGLPWIASQINSILTWENNIKSVLATCSFVGAVYVVVVVFIRVVIFIVTAGFEFMFVFSYMIKFYLCRTGA